MRFLFFFGFFVGLLWKDFLRFGLYVFIDEILFMFCSMLVGGDWCDGWLIEFVNFIKFFLLSDVIE